MKPVFQTITGKDKGTCMQAVLASLFETEIKDTVNPKDYPDTKWHLPFFEWIKSVGYDYSGMRYPCADQMETLDRLHKSPSVDGFWYASVNSRTFEGVTHAVIIDCTGRVVHDPNPNKHWLGINIIWEKEIIYWYMFEKSDNPVSKFTGGA